jgi:DNA-binding MarR family transcriptional regulator
MADSQSVESRGQRAEGEGLDSRTVVQLEQVLGQLSEVLEEVFERRLLEQILGDPDEVSLAQLRTLRFLVGLPDGQAGFAVGKIAEGLRISYPAASKAVDRLTERGLAERKRDNTDARSIVVRLTERGHDLTERLGTERRQKLELVLERLGGERPAMALLTLLEQFLALSIAE